MDSSRRGDGFVVERRRRGQQSVMADLCALWYLSPVVDGGQSVGLRNRLGIVAKAAVAVYVGVGLVAGVVYELTLAAGGAGFGGLHDDTFTSFALLPGYPVPAVLLTMWMTRRYGLDARDLFFVAGAMSWYETLVIGGGALLAAPLFAPAVVAFYVASYAVYNGAYGLLLIEPKQIWSDQPIQISMKRKLGYGVLIGAVSWSVFLVWAAVIS